VAEGPDGQVPDLQFTVPSEEMMIRILGAAGQVMITPGYILYPADATEIEGQPTDLDAEDRPVDDFRDASAMPELNREGVVLRVALDELSSSFKMPILVAGEAPEEPFALNAPEGTVADLMARMAESCGMASKPVRVFIAITTENIADAMKYVTDEELLDGINNGPSGMMMNMPPQARQQALQMAYQYFQEMSPEDRASTVRLFNAGLSAVHGRLQNMTGPRADTAMGNMRGFFDDALGFYRGLAPGQRTEIQPIAELIQKLRAQM
jgi:hypothetical protein